MGIDRYIQHREDIIILKESDTAKKAIDMMIERESGAVLVAVEDYVLIGILTERDIMTRVTAKGLDPYMTPLSDVMTKGVETLSERDFLEDAIGIMRNRRIRHLPILNRDGHIMGMLSTRYFLHDTLMTLVEELNSLEAYLNDAPGG